VIAGHFGLAAAVKAREPRLPLWTLMLATAWLDILFVPLLLAGRESIENAPGFAPGYGSLLIHADYTHSLLGAVLLSILLGVVLGWRWGRRAALLIMAVAFSHWVLDLVVHRADMPILPGNAAHWPELGFGLWRIPALSAVAELALIVAGSTAYWRAARDAAIRAGRSSLMPAHVSGAFVLLAGLLVLFLDFEHLLP